MHTTPFRRLNLAEYWGNHNLGGPFPPFDTWIDRLNGIPERQRRGNLTKLAGKRYLMTFGVSMEYSLLSGVPVVEFPRVRQDDRPNTLAWSPRAATSKIYCKTDCKINRALDNCLEVLDHSRRSETILAEEFR
jgi:hypothetical protein